MQNTRSYKHHNTEQINTYTVQYQLMRIRCNTSDVMMKIVI